MGEVYTKPANTMPLVPSVSDALSWRLNTFKPSDRAMLLKHMENASTRQEAFDAVVKYVRGWEEAASIEAYSIARVGKWIARSAPAPLARQLRDWANVRKSIPANALISGMDDAAKSN